MWIFGTVEKIKKYGARPEDETPEQWLYDEKIHQGLIDFDEQLERLLDPFHLFGGP
jgi:hypothetical protein